MGATQSTEHKDDNNKMYVFRTRDKDNNPMYVGIISGLEPELMPSNESKYGKKIAVRYCSDGDSLQKACNRTYGTGWDYITGSSFQREYCWETARNRDKRVKCYKDRYLANENAQSKIFCRFGEIQPNSTDSIEYRYIPYDCDKKDIFPIQYNSDDLAYQKCNKDNLWKDPLCRNWAYNDYDNIKTKEVIKKYCNDKIGGNKWCQDFKSKNEILYNEMMKNYCNNPELGVKNKKYCKKWCLENFGECDTSAKDICSKIVPYSNCTFYIMPGESNKKIGDIVEFNDAIIIAESKSQDYSNTKTLWYDATLNSQLRLMYKNLSKPKVFYIRSPNTSYINSRELKAGNEFVLSGQTYANKTDNCGWYGCRVAYVSSESGHKNYIRFHHGGDILEKNKFKIRRSIGKPILNEIPIKYGEPISITKDAIYQTGNDKATHYLQNVGGYIKLSTFNNDDVEFCSCYNSEVKNIEGTLNPKCYDKLCMDKGYRGKIHKDDCVSVTCTQISSMKAGENIVVGDINQEQNCGITQEPKIISPSEFEEEQKRLEEEKTQIANKAFMDTVLLSGDALIELNNINSKISEIENVLESYDQKYQTALTIKSLQKLTESEYDTKNTELLNLKTEIDSDINSAKTLYDKVYDSYLKIEVFSLEASKNLEMIKENNIDYFPTGQEYTNKIYISLQEAKEKLDIATNLYKAAEEQSLEVQNFKLTKSEETSYQIFIYISLFLVSIAIAIAVASSKNKSLIKVGVGIVPLFASIVYLFINELAS